MKSARNATKEKNLAIELDGKDFDHMLVDRRNGMRLGTIRQICDQFGIKTKFYKGKVILNSERDGMQMLVEKLHFCRIKYFVLLS